MSDSDSSDYESAMSDPEADRFVERVSGDGTVWILVREEKKMMGVKQDDRQEVGSQKVGGGQGSCVPGIWFVCAQCSKDAAREQVVP